jgi:ABC-type lipoprotein release transport system permease subunit
MSIALNKRQLLVFALVLLSLLVAALIVIHSVMPNLWNEIYTVSPKIIIHHY